MGVWGRVEWGGVGVGLGWSGEGKGGMGRDWARWGGVGWRGTRRKIETIHEK